MRPRRAVPLRVAKHIDRLCLRDEADYAEWCRARGFRVSCQKSWSELDREWCAYGGELATARESLRVDRAPQSLLVRVCAGEIGAAELSRPRWRALAERIERAGLDRGERRALRSLASRLRKRGNLLLAEGCFGDERFPYVDGLIALSRAHPGWIRSPNLWVPRSHNARRQFASLSRHLLARYPVPAFLDAAWLRGDPAADRYRAWFRHIGAGRSLRLLTAPIRWTKRAGHHFLRAPEHYSVEQALRWGQIRALGGEPRLVEAVVASRLGTSLENEAFWSTVLAFLARHPWLDPAQVGPIVDYLHDQRFTRQDVFVARGDRRQLPPPQPRLSMKGRSLEALLRQVERWHRDLARSGPGAGRSWGPSGIGELDFETGVRGENLRVWRVRELLSAAELRREGSAMHHCVATYASGCASGHSSIWTLELWSFERVQKRLTIALNANHVIVECRGRCNRPPNTQERQILSRWAEQEGLTISRFAWS